MDLDNVCDDVLLHLQHFLDNLSLFFLSCTGRRYWNFFGPYTKTWQRRLVDYTSTEPVLDLIKPDWDTIFNLWSTKGLTLESYTENYTANNVRYWRAMTKMITFFDLVPLTFEEKLKVMLTYNLDVRLAHCVSGHQNHYNRALTIVFKWPQVTEHHVELLRSLQPEMFEVSRQELSIHQVTATILDVVTRKYRFYCRNCTTVTPARPRQMQHTCSKTEVYEAVLCKDATEFMLRQPVKVTTVAQLRDCPTNKYYEPLVQMSTVEVLYDIWSLDNQQFAKLVVGKVDLIVLLLKKHIDSCTADKLSVHILFLYDFPTCMGDIPVYTYVREFMKCMKVSPHKDIVFASCKDTVPETTCGVYILMQIKDIPMDDMKYFNW